MSEHPKTADAVQRKRIVSENITNPRHALIKLLGDIDVAMLRIVRFHELLSEYRGKMERNEDTHSVVKKLANIQQRILFVDNLGRFAEKAAYTL